MEEAREDKNRAAELEFQARQDKNRAAELEFKARQQLEQAQKKGDEQMLRDMVHAFMFPRICIL